MDTIFNFFSNLGNNVSSAFNNLKAQAPSIQVPQWNVQQFARSYKPVVPNIEIPRIDVGAIAQKWSNQIAKTPVLNLVSPVKYNVGPNIGDAFNIGTDILRSTPRAIGAGVLSAYDIPEFTPETPSQRFVFGNEPIRNVQGQIKHNTEWGNQYGIGGAMPALTLVGLGMDAVPFVGGGKKQVAESIAQRAARTELKGLLGYSDELLRQGYKPSQIDKISYSIFKEMGNGKLTKEAYQGFKQIFSKWIGARDVAKTTGTQIASKLSNIPVDKGMDVIRYIENPHIKVSDDIKTSASALRKEFDDLYTLANRAGIDVGYLKNYITHIWKQSPEVVQETFARAGQRFGFSKQRFLQSYDEGIKLGLQPRYTHPAEILAHYATKLEETKANIKFIDDLKKQGLISEGVTPGFSPIVGQGIREGYFAPSGLAKVINRIFSPEDVGLVGKTMDIGHKISGKIQDVTLSGGIPKTPLNAFSFAQLTKEFLAGRLTSPLSATFRSMNSKWSNEFFINNVKQVKKLQSQGVPLNTSFNISNLIDKGVVKNLFGEDLGQAWNKVISEPTFQRLLPMLQVNLFNDIEKAALRAGRNADEAIELGAKAVKNFYGVTDSGELAMRSKLTEDTMGTFLFAPKYRESMVNFWLNNLKAITNPLAPENQTNVKFLLGAVITYWGMNELNKKYSGHDLIDNPPGMEDKLLIPLGDGYTLGIPFLSSIATVPRGVYREGKALLSGDIVGAAKDAYQTYSSSMIKPIGELATNQNYFGQEIYNKEGTAGEIAGDVGMYLAGLSHPYVRAGIEKSQGKYPNYQIALKTLELPLRFYKTDSLDARFYYANRDETLKTLSKEEKSVYDKLHSGNSLDEDGEPVFNQQQAMSNALTRLSNWKVFEAEQKIAYETAKKTKEPLNPLYALNPDQQRVVLTLKTFYPGDSTKSQMVQANQDWLKEYWKRQEAYSKYMVDKGVYKEFNSNKPKADQQLQNKLDYYNTLPKGTGARSAFLRAYPDVLDFFTKNREYTNSQRADLGLPLLADMSSSYSGGRRYSARVKKVSLKLPKVKKLKIKTAKVKAFKPLKISKLKMPKASKLKYA